MSLAASPAAAEILCKARSGRLFIRASCKKRETPLDLPKGQAGDPGAPPGAPVRVVDNAGLQVGEFAEPGRDDDDTSVVFEHDGHLVRFITRPAGFPSFGSLYHLVAQCADAPFMGASSTVALVRFGFVIGSAGFYAGDPVEMKAIVSQEYTPPNGSCGMAETLPNGNCCQNSSMPIMQIVGPATKVFDLPSLGLTPPFHLQP
ncbi:MAG TPA: hypothetical protein VMS22_03950 [Candidatus Eisenbacteria bacterium]|nr:hypothetical protein [Candidatus Eisenbacteria bacterium]